MVISLGARQNGDMGRLLLRLLINTLALWLTTLILATHVDVRSYGAEGDTVAFVLTLMLVALIFGLVNGIVGEPWHLAPILPNPPG